MSASGPPTSTGEPTVWKFGYGSNMSQDFLRTKKALNPLDCRKTVLRGWSLSFPEGAGIDYVEPAFATLKREPNGEVHGVSTLLCASEAARLDKQEGGYVIEVCTATIYDGSYNGSTELPVEVYAPRTTRAATHPEGCCSRRYRDILVRGAVECELEASWVEKLRNLPVYRPSQQTLEARAALPSPSMLPQMSVEELAKHNGSSEDLPIYVCICGFIFEHRHFIRACWGRDMTYRMLLHVRGINLEANDDGGHTLPSLSQMAAGELEYVLQYRDRFNFKSQGGALAVLREFWEQQEPELAGVYTDNNMSK